MTNQETVLIKQNVQYQYPKKKKLDSRDQYFQSWRTSGTHLKDQPEPNFPTSDIIP